jgi:mycothione reductase
MKEYDVISIGSGSAMSIVNAMFRSKPGLRAAVIDKDEPGGICLTRGCIPTKILLYPAELVGELERARTFGLDVELKAIHFDQIMRRMRQLIDGDIGQIREGLSNSPGLDYYPAPAEFVEPYTLRVRGETIRGNQIFLCTGSRPTIPRIAGLDGVGYLTSDSALHLSRLPGRLAVIGGGYIAAELGHFFARMGSAVTILGRNAQFLPGEEPEVSAVARASLEDHLTIRTNVEVTRAESIPQGKRLYFVDRAQRHEESIDADEILVAAGRESISDVLHPDRAGIKTDEHGWIQVNEFLETSQPNVWALGDATGRFPFKHKANYDAKVVYYNAVLGRRTATDYHAVPHAVFTDPEVASVGLREREALEAVGRDRLLVGFYRYEDTAKGEAMSLHRFFVKVLVEEETFKILGAHIVGPQASILLQEVVNLLYTADRSARPIREGMHIHPAMSEVVERAFLNLIPWHHFDEHRVEMTGPASVGA